MFGHGDHCDADIGRDHQPVRELRSGLPGLGGPPSLHPAWREPGAAAAPTGRRRAADASFARWLAVRRQTDDGA